MTQDEACKRIINNENVYAVIDAIYENFESIACILCKDCIYWKPELIPHGSSNGYKKNLKSCTFLSINTSQHFGCIQGEAKQELA